MKIVSKLTFLGIILFFSINAYAGQLDSSGLLDILLDKFQQVASTWTTVIADYANWLFWGLVLISMVWTFGMMAMQGEGLTGVLAEIVRFFAVVGFFYYLCFLYKLLLSLMIYQFLCNSFLISILIIY